MKDPYELARAEIGTVEWADGSNPKVVAYFRDAGHATIKDDATAWCAAFVGAMLHRAGKAGTGKLTARSYLQWGDPVDLDDARPGDLVVFKRGNSSWQGHVGFFVKRSGAFIEVLGGNQSNAVNVSRYAVASLLGVRREKAPPRPAPTQRPAARPTAPMAPPAPGDSAKPATSLLAALWRALVGFLARWKP